MMRRSPNQAGLRQASPDSLTKPRGKPKKPKTRVGFLIGLGGMLFVRLGGYLSLSEIFLFARFLLNLPSYCGREWRIAPYGFVLFWLMWLVCAIVSEIVNSTPTAYALKGVARIVFIGTTTLGVYAFLFRATERLAPMLWGVAISMCLGLFILSPGQYVGDEQIVGRKFTFTHSYNYIILATMHATLATFYRFYKKTSIAILVLSGIGFIGAGSRSAGGCQIAAALTLLASTSYLQGSVGRRLKPFALLAGFGAVAISICAIALLYNHVVRSSEFREFFGVSRHFEGTASEALAESRGVFFLTGYLGWLDRPVLGHGSWPASTDSYLIRACELLSVDPRPLIASYTNPDRQSHGLPVHSMLMQSAVEHGIFGLLFTAYIIWIYLTSSLTAMRVYPGYAAFICLASWTGVWGVLFSPPPHRMLAAIPWAVLLLTRKCVTATSDSGNASQRKSLWVS